MAVTQPIFKLEPPDFTWQQIWIIPPDDDNYDDNGNNDKHHKSFEVSSVIPRWNRKIKETQNLTMTTMSTIMMTMTLTMTTTTTTITKIINLCSIKCVIPH